MVNKTIGFRETLSHIAPHVMTKLLREDDTNAVTGIFIGDNLVGWFDDYFVRDCDCYLSIIHRDMAQDILCAAQRHSDETGQKIIVDGEMNWKNYVR